MTFHPHVLNGRGSAHDSRLIDLSRAISTSRQGLPPLIPKHRPIRDLNGNFGCQAPHSPNSDPTRLLFSNGSPLGVPSEGAFRGSAFFRGEGGLVSSLRRPALKAGESWFWHPTTPAAGTNALRVFASPFWGCDAGATLALGATSREESGAVARQDPSRFWLRVPCYFPVPVHHKCSSC